MRYPHFEIDIDGMYTTVLCGRGEVLKHFMAFISFCCIGVVIVLLFNCCSRTWKRPSSLFKKEGHKIGAVSSPCGRPSVWRCMTRRRLDLPGRSRFARTDPRIQVRSTSQEPSGASTSLKCGRMNCCKKALQIRVFIHIKTGERDLGDRGDKMAIENEKRPLTTWFPPMGSTPYENKMLGVERLYIHLLL